VDAVEEKAVEYQRLLNQTCVLAGER
jgi:hypothetical protein